MERNQDGHVDLFELGVASTETRGIEGMIPDWAHGQDPARLSDD